MIWKKYLYHDLSFSNKGIAQEYEKSKGKYNSLLLFIITLHTLMISIVGLVLNPFNQPLNRTRMVSIFSISICCLVIALIGVKKPPVRDTLLMALATASFFWVMENQVLNEGAVDETLNILLGMNTEIIGVSLMLAKISWKFSSAFQLLMNCFCAFRYTNFEKNYELKFYPLAQFLSKTILISFSAYFLEKYDKENFERIKNYEYSLSCFKDLITKFFPSAVLIIKDDKILFHNEKTLKILECEGESQVWNRLESLKLDEVYESSENNFHKDYLCTEDGKAILSDNCKETSLKMAEILDHKSTSPKTFYCLVDLINKQRSLEMSLAKIIWEDEMALMIILSENEILGKMKVINEQSEYKDRLLATVSHDLRTPLNGIMGMIQMTIDINQETQTRKFLNIALRSSQLLLLMINDILDFSQISNGKLRLNFETFCLWSLIKDVSKLFKFQAKMKGLEFHKENNSGTTKEKTVIRSDQNRIKQVLFNLLGNALKFTTEGSIKVSLMPWTPKTNFSSSTTCDLIIPRQRAYVISVQDTGIGIKKEDQGNLFKLYGKLQNENTSVLNKNGVGLGLAVSQSLVRVLNKDKKDGEITVVSEYKKGSCFSFVLLSNDEEVDKREEIFHMSIEEKSENEMKANLTILEREIDSSLLKAIFKRKKITNMMRKKKILVVDDDQINIFVISSYMKTFVDYEYDVSFNGEEAIQNIKRKAGENYFYDVVLMDYNMPKMNGPQALFIINQMIENHEIPSLAVIICTANVSIKELDFSFQNGVLDLITKPFTKEQIRKKIEGILV